MEPLAGETFIGKMMLKYSFIYFAKLFTCFDKARVISC